MKSLISFACLCALCGCTTTKTSGTPRTATEQLLISNAVDQSLSRVDFSTFTGRKVFLEEKYMEGIDSKYVLASIRHRIILNGGKLMDKKDDSDVTIELRSGGLGTDLQEMYVGVPEVTLPGMVSIPEIKMITRDAQSAAAKIGMVAYETKSGEIFGPGGVSLAESDRNDWFVMGVGPYQNGSLKEEKLKAKRVGQTVESMPVPNQVAFDQPRNSPTQSGRARIQLAGEEKPVFMDK